MKLPFLLLLLTALPAFPQSRDERWREDLDALRAYILRIHPNPFTRTPPDVFEQRVAVVRSRIPDLNDAQVVVELAGIVGMLNDGHSSLSVVQPGTGVRRYPVVVRWFSDGLYVTGAPAAAVRLVGNRIVSMNGLATEAAFEAVRPWLAYDTEEWARSESELLMMIHEVLIAAGIVTPGGTLKIEVEGAGGQRVADEITLSAGAPIIGPVVARPIMPVSRRGLPQQYWFEWLEGERALYVQYNRCSENALLPMSAFVEEIEAFVREHRPEIWIFDLRDNPGGNEIYFRQLYYYLRDAVKQGRISGPSKGIRGIINKRTFSSGVLAAEVLQSEGALIFGEPTGGRTHWFGHPPQWVLPNSRFAVSVSADLVGDGIGRNTTPNVAVEFNGQDWFRFKDPYLERALLGR